MFFDIHDNTFVCQMIPSCYDDDLFIDNDFIQKVLISEDMSVDMTTVRNVCEVWGEVFETDFFTETCTYSNNIFSCNVDKFGDAYSLSLIHILFMTPKILIRYLSHLVRC